MAQLVPIDLTYLGNFDRVCSLRLMFIQVIKSKPKTIWGASLQRGFVLSNVYATLFSILALSCPLCD